MGFDDECGLALGLGPPYVGTPGQLPARVGSIAEGDFIQSRLQDVAYRGVSVGPDVDGPLHGLDQTFAPGLPLQGEEARAALIGLLVVVDRLEELLHLLPNDGRHGGAPRDELLRVPQADEAVAGAKILLDGRLAVLAGDPRMVGDSLDQQKEKIK